MTIPLSHDHGCRAEMGHIAAWSYETVLAADPVSASKARDFVCLHLVEHELGYLVEDIRLVVSELATNAMTHSTTPFTITLSQTDDIVQLAVRDSSPSLPVRAVQQGMDVGGRGLAIVELLSRDCGVRTDDFGSKSVWASFALTATLPASSARGASFGVAHERREPDNDGAPRTLTASASRS
ncbi:MAG: ATP-binding protein [Propionibacteriales bacterium]|nr:ATP-binding protein [Propionibacteriales bacterium]